MFKSTKKKHFGKRGVGNLESNQSKPSTGMDRIDWVQSRLQFGLNTDEERLVLQERLKFLISLGLQPGTNDCLSMRHADSCRIIYDLKNKKNKNSYSSYTVNSQRRKSLSDTDKQNKKESNSSTEIEGTVYKVRGRKFGKSNDQWICLEKDGTVICFFNKGSEARKFLEEMK